MITLFNRRELAVTQSMCRQGEIRALLAANGIDYRLKTRGQNDSLTRSDTRARFGSAGIDLEYQYIYTFYVHQNDYEKALHVIGQHTAD